ncbi:MAG: hypothetical protein ABI811_17470 [Acidobacteriota bacterium]
MERMEKPGADLGGNDKLAGLFAEYRGTFPDTDSSPEFMPKLWQRIEARRRETTSIFRHLTQAFVAITAALLIILTTVLMPTSPDVDLYSSTYTEVVAADHADRDYVQALPADLPGEVR